MTRRILDLFFGRSLRRHTSRYLEELASAPLNASRRQTIKILTNLANTGTPAVTLGTTTWGQMVGVPVSEVLTAHALITGGSGAGKTRFALLILQGLIDQLPETESFGFGLIDPKGELFDGALFLLARRLADLDRSDPDVANELRRRIVILDFSTSDPVSAYNLLARGPNVDLNFFADNRADLLTDLLPRNDNFTVNGNAVLRRAIRLLVECHLPITHLDDVLHDDDLRRRLLGQSRDPVLHGYFARQFPSIPKQTITALSRRVETLFSSQGVRLALAGLTAPDFRAFQDDGKIVLINCFGQNMSRSVGRLLQALVLSDIHQAVFSRQRKTTPFLWFLDECQNFFVNERLRDHMGDLLTLARSFGSYFLCLTQNVTTAVHDTRLLADIFTNSKWTFSMRGQAADCAFLKSALPVTGRKPRPQTNPFEEPGFCSISEERAMELDAIASLPDQTGFFWPRSHSPEAVKISTQNLPLPHGEALDRAIEALRSDPTIGGRISRQAYEADLARCDEPPVESPADFSGVLAAEYKRRRGRGE